MVLKLEIVQTPQGVSLPEASKTISEQGGSIGRGENNTWILDDPERFLSSRHCEVVCEAGQFFLVDTSTNGTFVNGAPEPLGRGNRLTLKNGDSFEVGDYKFNVSLEASAEDAFSGAPLPLDPFDVPASPFADVQSDAGPAASIDDFLSGAAANSGGAIPLGDDDFSFSNTDPLAALDKAAPQPDPFSLPGDPFATPQTPAQESYPYGQNSFNDSSDPLSGSFQMPQPKADAGMIPEGWEDDDDWLNSAEPAPPVEPTPPPVAPVEAKVEVPPPPPQPRTERERPAVPPRSTVSPAAQRDISQPSAVVAHKSDRAAPQRRAVRSAERDLAPGGGRKAVLKDAVATSKVLLEAMGLSPDDLTVEQQQKITRQVGELLPVVIQGMMNVLRSRASIKNEFRMSVTTIQPVENNPLKFSADTQEAVENMFVRDSRAYKGPIEAFGEGFDAIAEHQVAIIAGIRAAFSSMLDQFNPETLEKQFDKQHKGVVLPGMQKARYWSSYTEFYQSAMDNIEQSFQNLFGDEFVRAYEDQLFKLVSARNQKK